jgi:hypothetical protein
MKIPHYQDAEKVVEDPDQEATLLEMFIYECSPDGYAEQSMFRWHLQRLLDHLEEELSKSKDTGNSKVKCGCETCDGIDADRSSYP